MPHWRHHPAVDWFITLVCTQLLLIVFHQMALGSSANLRLYDQLLMKTGYTARPDIVVVGIDDRAIEELGGWPLKRQHYADLLQRLQDQTHAAARVEELEAQVRTARQLQEDAREAERPVEALVKRADELQGLSGGQGIEAPEDPWMTVSRRDGPQVKREGGLNQGGCHGSLSGVKWAPGAYESARWVR